MSAGGTVVGGLYVMSTGGHSGRGTVCNVNRGTVVGGLYVKSAGGHSGRETVCNVSRGAQW